MATLTKQDRIEISKRLVNIDNEIKAADDTLVLVQQAQVDAKNKDEANKKLQEDKTSLINSYQSELIFLDGFERTELTESEMLDSANRILNNSFFPNDPQSPLPSISDGVWKNYTPFSQTHAIGKDNFESYISSGNRVEQDIIDDIEADIALVEAELVSRRATGLECIPGTPDTYSPYVTIQNLLINIKSLVQEWEDILNDEKVEIPSEDPDSARALENTNAINDIDNAISVIDTWQSIQDFDTTTSLPSGSGGSACAIFDAMVEGDFQQTKLQPTTLQLLKDELTARTSYISIRTTQLQDDYLGEVIQDLSTGLLTSTSGLYGDRMLFIDMRLNVLGGTLNNLVGSGKEIEAQEGVKELAENSRSGLESSMAASKTITPGLNNQFINIKNGSNFNSGDRIYLVADNQEELSGSIVNISNNGNYYRIELSFPVPKKYTLSNDTRIYKLL